MDLDVPLSKLKQIESQFTSDEERKDEVIRIYHTQHPHPTWEHVSDVLYTCGGFDDDQQYHNVLNRLQSMFPTGECLSLQPSKISTLGTHAQRGLRYLVCVSVSLREIWYYRHQAGIRAIRTASARHARENVCVASAKSTAFDLERSRQGRKTGCVTQPTNYRGASIRIIRTRVLCVVGSAKGHVTG